MANICIVPWNGGSQTTNINTRVSCQVCAMSPWAKATFQMDVWRMESPGIARFLSPSRTPGPIFRSRKWQLIFVFFPPVVSLFRHDPSLRMFYSRMFQMWSSSSLWGADGLQSGAVIRAPHTARSLFPRPRTPNIAAANQSFPLFPQGLRSQRGWRYAALIRELLKPDSQSEFQNPSSSFRKGNRCTDDGELHCRLRWMCRDVVCIDMHTVQNFDIQRCIQGVI